MSKQVLEKLEEIQKEIHEVKTNMAVNNEKMENYNKSLDIHIKRSENLETRIVPIESHVHLVKAVFKTIVFIGTIVGALVGIAIALFKQS